MQELREAPKSEGHDRIYTHGEKEYYAWNRVAKEGVPVNLKTLLEMKEMSDYLGMDFERYFGPLDLKNENYHSLY